MGIHALIEEMVQRNASDLHLVGGSPPVLRIHGALHRISETALTPEAISGFLDEMLTTDQFKQLETKRELDMAFMPKNISARFRVNVHFQQGSLAAVFRLIPAFIPSASSLFLPDVISDIANYPNGLVLLTGPTGSGKSTTLAVLIDLINTTQDKHIITVEDPIEFMHTHKKSLIEQRQVGHDTLTFPDALKGALRQDPDVILVGEMRDLDTISTAITAAETGHLVFSTLHTNDTAQAIDRIIDVFPAHQQNQIRLQLSMCLRAVMTQQLIPKKTGEGRVPAIEILLAIESVRNIIRKGNTHELCSVMEMESKRGMQTMSQAIKRLSDQGLIDPSWVGKGV